MKWSKNIKTSSSLKLVWIEASVLCFDTNSVSWIQSERPVCQLFLNLSCRCDLTLRLSLCVFQVAAQAVLFMCMNTAGIFISYLSDRAQRQAFLETRRCIEARLRLETENQRQVSRTQRDAAGTSTSG